MNAERFRKKMLFMHTSFTKRFCYSSVIFWRTFSDSQNAFTQQIWRKFHCEIE